MMLLVSDNTWVDCLEWRTIIAAGISVSTAVRCHAEAQASNDRGVHGGGEFPTFDRVQCMQGARALVRDMKAEYGWANTYRDTMRDLWAKSYEDQYKRDEYLDSFLRHVGQLK